ncbi:MAG: hypothetical protein ABSG67_21710, partial [Thermoguttaceae bacterium]
MNRNWKMCFATLLSIILITGVDQRIWATSYIAIDLNPSGFNFCICGGTDVVQQAGYGSGSTTGGNYHALLWSGSAASAVDLNPSGFDVSTARGISDAQ